jgi:hypothetical protein
MLNYGLIYIHMGLGVQIFPLPTGLDTSIMGLSISVSKTQNSLLRETLISDKTRVSLLPGRIAWTVKQDLE